MRRVFACAIVIGTTVVLLPGTASAQASISGLVQDSTGAVLPGVTVESSSPALIERVRSAVTDSSGRYTIVDLRPGTYSVTFTLTGFNTLKREGIVLEGAVTAQVNAEMQVGAVEETVTVSGQSPLVDVQNTQRQAVINREMLDVLPAVRNFTARGNLIPGVTTQSIVQSYEQGFGSYPMTIHGSSAADTWVFNDGMRAAQWLTENSPGAWFLNDAATVELAFDTGAQSAENQTSGVRMNAIPKDGGNVLSGTFVAYGAVGEMQSDNRTPEVKALIGEANHLAHTYEVNPAVGGPIRRNRLWFFGSAKVWSTKSYVAGTFYPDGRQAFNEPYPDPARSGLLRLTYQMNPRNKLRLSFDRSNFGLANAIVGNGVQPEASTNLKLPVGHSGIVKWSSTATNRLLFEAGLSEFFGHFWWEYQPGVGPYDLPHIELTTGRTTVALSPKFDRLAGPLYNAMGSASYVTGSHAIKVGFGQVWGTDTNRWYHNGDVLSLNFLNLRPSSVTVVNTPMDSINQQKVDLGLYAQDVWTIRRFTLNVGARYDHFNAGIPAQAAPPGRFAPARQFAAIEDAPNWNTFAVRLGVAYDLFGTGKTALKGNVSKFVGAQGLGLTAMLNPMNQVSEQRSWTDLDLNGSILDANGNAQYAEIGPARNDNFGLVAALRMDANLPRDYNWEESVLIQHELRPTVSVAAGYYRRQFYNLRWTNNVLVDPDRDYTPFTFTGPQDPRLPNGGGEVITQYNLNEAKLGQVDQVIMVSTTNRRVYDGFEVSVNARARNGVFIFGGVTTERTKTSTCQVANPNQRRFCDNAPPFRTQAKASGAYTLPYDVQLSATLVLRPGASYGANYAVNSAIAGVPLTGGGSLSVPLIEPNTEFYDYVRSFDLRIARTFRSGRMRAQPQVDIFNLFNSSTITSVNQNYGVSWLRPQAVLEPRYWRLGVQLDF
jgi:hypothetical protein